MKNKIWLLYIIPALCIPLYYYLIRVLVPDHSFDSINYHIYLGELGIKNFPFSFGKNEFFPLGLHSFVPFYEYFSAFFRIVLGYRLGTLPSVIFFMGIIIILYKIIKLIQRDYFESFKIVRFILFLNACIIFELLFQTATYFVDITNTFFLLMTFYVLLLYFKKKNTSILFIFSFLLGISIYAKWTNLVFLPGFTIVVSWLLWSSKVPKTMKIKSSIMSVLLISFPLLVNSLYLFNITENPLFPFFNGIFKSKFYAQVSFSNSDFGPKNILQWFIWPVYSLLHPERLGEVEKFFLDPKLSMYWLGSLFVFFLIKKDIRQSVIKLFIIFFYSGYAVWSMGFGYLRYASLLECIGGIVLIVSYTHISKKNLVLKSIFFAYLVIFSVFNFLTLRVNFKNDYSWRVSLYKDRHLYLSQLPFLFDNSFRLSRSIEDNVMNTDVYLNCALPNTGYYAGLPNKKPLLFLEPEGKKFGMSEEYFRKARRQIGIPENKPIRFTAITISEGWNPNDETCVQNLKKARARIFEREKLNTYFGYPIEGYIIIGEIPGAVTSR